MHHLRIVVALVATAGFLLVAAGSASANHTFGLLNDGFGFGFGFANDGFGFGTELCDTSRGGFGSFVDIDSRVTNTRSLTRSTDLDEDTVLLGIALSNNGFGSIDFDDLANQRSSFRQLSDVSQRTSLDREDALSALALGVHGFGGRDQRLACASDIDESIERSVTRSRDVSLDEDNVLLGIALRNNVGGFFDFEDIADIDDVRTSTFAFDHNVDIDRDDALWLLAFG